MLTLETLRAAAMADRPWTRLDELVRAELAAGRRVREVADDFDRLADEVWDTPELSDDGSDAFGDTLDALTGNCQQRHAYKDPPTLPTEAEVLTLPRWARVALAARCARRVLPMTRMLHGGVTNPLTQLVSANLRLVEQSAATGSSLGGNSAIGLTHTHRLTGDRQAIAALDAEAAATLTCATHGAAPFNAVLYSLVAALSDYSSVMRPFERVPRPVAPGSRWPQFDAALRRDFDRLADLAHHLRWTDDTPVSPDVFGPLWPEGPPAGWPADPDVPARAELPLTVTARDGVAPGVVVDEVVNLFNALNRFHVARTGRRLTLEGDVHTRLAALVPAGAA